MSLSHSLFVPSIEYSMLAILKTENSRFMRADGKNSAYGIRVIFAIGFAHPWSLCSVHDGDGGALGIHI